MTEMARQEKIDRRVIRTRRALHEALRSLIKEKDYATVTVEEITQRAGLGRATFYLHYRDKEDLLLEDLNVLARDRVRLLAEIPLSGWDEQSNPVFLPLLFVFKNAAENADLYRAVLHGEGAARVTTRLRDIILEALTSLTQAQNEQGEGRFISSAPTEFVASYLAGAMIGSLSWWLDQPTPHDPEDMTRSFQNLFLPGAARIFGIVPPASQETWAASRALSGEG